MMGVAIKENGKMEYNMDKVVNKVFRNSFYPRTGS